MTVATYLTELNQRIESLLQRPSIHSDKAKSAFNGAEGITTAREALDQAIGNLAEDDPFRKKLEELHANATSKLDHFKAVSQEKNGTRVAAEGKALEFKKAQAELENANAEIASLFEGKIDHHKSEAVTQAYEALTSKVDHAKGLLDGIFGRLRVEGAKSTLKHNLKDYKFWEEGYDFSKVAKKPLAFRSVGLVGAGVAIADSARSKTRDGEERNNAARIAELLAGVGIGTASLLAGRAS